MPPPSATPIDVAPGRRLPRLLGAGFGVAVGVGSMIGAGILRAPADVARLLPTPGLFLGVWLLGGAYALLGANALAELGAMHPRSGGQFALVRRAFGPFPGFVVGWNDWLSTCGSAAAVALVVGEALEALARLALGRPGPGAQGADVALGAARSGWPPLLAVALVAATVALVWREPRTADRAQRLASLAKGIALLALVASCLVHAAAHGLPPALSAAGGVAGAAAPSLPVRLGALVVALQGVIYAFDGWTGPLYFGEEVRDPGRDLPRAMLGGVLAGLALYLLVGIALLAVLPLPVIAGATLPAASAAGVVFGAAGAPVLRALVVVALPSAVLANLLMGSRVAFALGRDLAGAAAVDARSAGAGRALGWLAGTAPSGVPRPALAASAVAAMLFAATGAFERVIALCATLFVASYAVSYAAVFALRRREPASPRPWRAWGHPWTTGAVLAGSLAFLAGVAAAAPADGAMAAALVLASYPVHRLLGGRR